MKWLIIAVLILTMACEATPEPTAETLLYVPGALHAKIYEIIDDLEADIEVSIPEHVWVFCSHHLRSEGVTEAERDNVVILAVKCETTFPEFPGKYIISLITFGHTLNVLSHKTLDVTPHVRWQRDPSKPLFDLSGEDESVDWVDWTKGDFTIEKCSSVGQCHAFTGKLEAVWDAQSEIDEEFESYE